MPQWKPWGLYLWAGGEEAAKSEFSHAWDGLPGQPMRSRHQLGTDCIRLLCLDVNVYTFFLHTYMLGIQYGMLEYLIIHEAMNQDGASARVL